MENAERMNGRGKSGGRMGDNGRKRKEWWKNVR